MKYHLSPQQIETAVDKAARFLFDYCRQHSKHYLESSDKSG